jgi:hypothetical protein
MAAGNSAVTIEDPTALPAALDGVNVLCADTFDGDLVAEQVRARPGVRGVLWTAEPLKRSLRYLVETAAIDHVLGRRDFESVPTPPLSAYLDWGFTALDIDVRATSDREAAAAKIHEFVGALGVPRRVAEMFGELADELLMNAMYDAPVDAAGRPKYAADRKAHIELAAHERPALRIATDGTRLVLQVRDPFGRLERRHVFDGLVRGLASGEQDRSGGGAGLGMMVCHNASTAMFFDVVPHRHTEVTALFELDINLREFRTQAKSLHFWRH